MGVPSTLFLCIFDKHECEFWVSSLKCIVPRVGFTGQRLELKVQDSVFTLLVASFTYGGWRKSFTPS